MIRRLLMLSLALVALCSWAYADEGLLIHWAFDEGAGEVAGDSSGNGLAGTVAAAWTDSPSGRAVFLDGTSQRVVSTLLPEGKRLGTSSWTFVAWVKPTELSIDDRQNQRRLFSFGVYPDANCVIDLKADGALTSYFCYTDDAGKIVSTGGTSSPRVKTGEWAHVAVVCDREAGRIWSYVNGYAGHPSAIRPGFAGDFSLGGELTIGSAWHNYWGVVDEVQVRRRALSKAEVSDEFQRLRETYDVQESEEAIAARKLDRAREVLADANRAWAERDFAAVRSNCGAVMASQLVPAHFRSYAHLRLAQSYAAEGNAAEAQAAYTKIQANSAYPRVHRYEAGELAKELDRQERGLPPRDPASSRTPVPRISTFAAEVYVAPDGGDANDGSRQRPFASLGRARDAVREIKADGVDGAIAVTLLPGRYVLRDTFELTAQDSGTLQMPVIYRAEEKGTAVLYGGTRLRGFEPVTDPVILDRLPAESRGKVVQSDLKAQGITDYGELRARGFGQGPSPPTLELYFDGKPMMPARWPNEGFVGVKRLIDGGSRAEGTPSVFEYDDERHARWTQAEDAWLFGYFRFLWADATIKIGAIDSAARTVTTAEAYRYGGQGMTTEQGIIYYAFNLLEEIDRPGEWYLDRTSGVLYLLPPSDPSKVAIEMGMLSGPMVSAEGVSDVRFEGLVFDLGRFNCMTINDSTRCLVTGCVVTRIAGNGISIDGGEANGILGCDIRTIGRRAAEVKGGDRETLTPVGHFVENCRISDFGRIDRTYTPAIQLEGVGNRVAHNLMFDCPSSVMRIEGNDHVIEFNDVRDAVRESDDQGAMELFGNPSYRGVVFRYNRFRDVGKTGTEVSVHGQAGIRLDDAISGMLIYGNVFERSANGNFGGIQLNSGRDNIIDNNLFVDCERGVSGGWHGGNRVWQDLRAGKNPMAGARRPVHTSELYLSRYPEMRRMLESPGINHLWRNVFYRCGPVATGNPAYLDLFSNAALGDGEQDDAQLEAMGFRPIPVDEIGPYEDEHRAF